jgi:hypothetical protein
LFSILLGIPSMALCLADTQSRTCILCTLLPRDDWVSWSCVWSSVSARDVGDVVEVGCDGSVPGTVPAVGEGTDKAGGYMATKSNH